MRFDISTDSKVGDAESKRGKNEEILHLLLLLHFSTIEIFRRVRVGKKQKKQGASPSFFWVNVQQWVWQQFQALEFHSYSEECLAQRRWMVSHSDVTLTRPRFQALGWKLFFFSVPTRRQV